MVGYVEFAPLVLAKIADAERGVEEKRRRPGAPVLAGRPQPPGAEVAVQVETGEACELAAAIAIPPGDRAVTVPMGILEYREGQRAVVTAYRGIETGRSLH